MWIEPKWRKPLAATWLLSMLGLLVYVFWQLGMLLAILAGLGAGFAAITIGSLTFWSLHQFFGDH